MKQHIRYGNKNADGTVTWGDWQTSELSQTVGNDTTLIYVDNGEIKASTATVGSAAQPVYLNGGTVTATNFKYYTSLEQLGLDSSATIEDVWTALSTHSMAVIRTNEFSDLTQFPDNNNYGLLVILCENNRGFIKWVSKHSAYGDYRMFLVNGGDNDGKPDGVWWKIPYEQV